MSLKLGACEIREMLLSCNYIALLFDPRSLLTIISSIGDVAGFCFSFRCQESLGHRDFRGIFRIVCFSFV